MTCPAAAQPTPGSPPSPPLPHKGGEGRLRPGIDAVAFANRRPSVAPHGRRVSLSTMLRLSREGRGSEGLICIFKTDQAVSI